MLLSFYQQNKFPKHENFIKAKSAIVIQEYTELCKECGLEDLVNIK